MIDYISMNSIIVNLLCMGCGTGSEGKNNGTKHAEYSLQASIPGSSCKNYCPAFHTAFHNLKLDFPQKGNERKIRTLSYVKMIQNALTIVD
jgi:hypothetical protein